MTELQLHDAERGVHHFEAVDEHFALPAVGLAVALALGPDDECFLDDTSGGIYDEGVTGVVVLADALELAHDELAPGAVLPDDLPCADDGVHALHEVVDAVLLYGCHFTVCGAAAEQHADCECHDECGNIDGTAEKCCGDMDGIPVFGLQLTHVGDVRLRVVLVYRVVVHDKVFYRYGVMPGWRFCRGGVMPFTTLIYCVFQRRSRAIQFIVHSS